MTNVMFGPRGGGLPLDLGCKGRVVLVVVKEGVSTCWVYNIIIPTLLPFSCFRGPTGAQCQYGGSHRDVDGRVDLLMNVESSERPERATGDCEGAVGRGSSTSVFGLGGVGVCRTEVP